MLQQYFSILLFILIGILFSVLPAVVSSFITPRDTTNAKLASYECGFEAFENARTKFDVRYYLVAILFIIFDLEIAFLFPWAIALENIGWPGLIGVLIFLSLLTIGFIFEWRKGALTWE